MRKTLSIFLLPLALLLGGNTAVAHGMQKHMVASEPWKAPASQAKRSNPMANSTTVIKQGQQLFLQYCTACHGPSGGGDGKSEATRIQHKIANNSDGELAYKTSQGRGQMPSWSALLNDEQIWSLVTFMKTLTPSTQSSSRGDN